MEASGTGLKANLAKSSTN